MQAEEDKKRCQVALDEAAREEMNCQNALQKAREKSNMCRMALEQAKEACRNRIREMAVVDARVEAMAVPIDCLSHAMELLYHPPLVSSSRASSDEEL